jgi:hypothetical protein
LYIADLVSRALKGRVSTTPISADAADNLSGSDVMDARHRITEEIRQFKI